LPPDALVKFRQPELLICCFEMAAKRKFAAVDAVPEEPTDPSDELFFTCLGGGNEVGRSCHIVQYKGKTIMVSKK
jgi:predicted metal-dependent RNase